MGICEAPSACQAISMHPFCLPVLHPDLHFFLVACPLLGKAGICGAPTVRKGTYTPHLITLFSPPIPFFPLYSFPLLSDFLLPPEGGSGGILSTDCVPGSLHPFSPCLTPASCPVTPCLLASLLFSETRNTHSLSIYGTPGHCMCSLLSSPSPGSLTHGLLLSAREGNGHF